MAWRFWLRVAKRPLPIPMDMGKAKPYLLSTNSRISSTEILSILLSWPQSPWSNAWTPERSRAITVAESVAALPWKTHFTWRNKTLTLTFTFSTGISWRTVSWRTTIPKPAKKESFSSNTVSMTNPGLKWKTGRLLLALQIRFSVEKLRYRRISSFLVPASCRTAKISWQTYTRWRWIKTVSSKRRNTNGGR